VGLDIIGCLATGGKYHVRQDEEINSGRGRALPKADTFDEFFSTDRSSNSLTKLTNRRTG
jgi:hypothetical protein